MEGTRPVLVEVQALAAKSGYGTPQRVATGLDPKRLAVLLAVLERRAETSFADLDVFVQVTAGVRLSEPGADLAVAAALHLQPLQPAGAARRASSSARSASGGEIRPSGAIERRIAEAARLGFRRVFGSSRSGTQVAGVSMVGSRSRRAAGAGACRVTSASSSSRRGRARVWAARYPKQYRPIAGVPMVLRALRPFASHPDVAQVALVLPPADADVAAGLPRGPSASGLASSRAAPSAQTPWPPGWRALAPACTIVLVHDAARPFVDARR